MNILVQTKGNTRLPNSYKGSMLKLVKYRMLLEYLYKLIFVLNISYTIDETCFTPFVYKRSYSDFRIHKHAIPNLH